MWEASGHITEFADPPSSPYPATTGSAPTTSIEAYEEKHGYPPANGQGDMACPNCGTRGQFTEPRMFSGLLRTYLGAAEDESGLAYLRPETAQGIFINFRNVLQTSRRKIPFGIGQIGKSFRNEITPGNFIFRTREFEQMEMEFFVKPGTDEDWHDRWIDARFGWYADLGLRKENLGGSSTRRTSARTTPSAPWTSSTGMRSPAPSGASSRASPTGPTTT